MVVYLMLLLLGKILSTGSLDLKRSNLKSLKGTSGRKKVKLKWKSVKNAKQRAVTDLNAPNGSRDIPFQSQEFEQYGRRHFVDF